VSEDTTPKLQLVRLYLGEQRMDVGFFDPTIPGPRLIKYEWQEKHHSDFPPEGWYEAVVGEVQFQRAQELKARAGRLIPME